MTIKAFNAGSLALSEIQAEFGGSNPIGLDEYYAGGSFVNSGILGYPNGSPVAIPTSGAISVSNFYGARREPTGPECANYFWTYRGGLVRYNGDSGGFPGNDYRINNPNARYVNSVTNNWSYSNAGLPTTSEFFTILSVSSGNIASNGGIQGGPGVSGSTAYELIFNPAREVWVGDGGPSAAGSPYGVSYKITWYRGQVNTVTNTSLTTAHGGGNNGAWTGQFLIPGKYMYPDVSINFDPNGTRVVGPGSISVTVIERGGNGSSPIPNPSGLGQIMTADMWWYNAAGWQVGTNISAATPANMTWSGNNGGLGGWTPRVAFTLNRFF